MEQTSHIDKRTQDRISLDSPMRYLTRGEEFSGATLKDISLSGAAIYSSRRPGLNEKVIAYVGDMIRLEGNVVRFFRDGFAICFSMSSLQLERLVRHLPALRQEIRDQAEESGAIRTCQGVPLQGWISALSVVGAIMESRARPALGTTLMLGSKPVRVVSHTRSGFTVEFSEYWNNLPRWGYHGYYARAS